MARQLPKPILQMPPGWLHPVPRVIGGRLGGAGGNRRATSFVMNWDSARTRSDRAITPRMRAGVTVSQVSSNICAAIVNKFRRSV
jgi:hypothetical protein